MGPVPAHGRRRRRPDWSDGDKFVVLSWLYEPPKFLQQRVIDTVNVTIAESDLEDLLKGEIRPHRLREVSAGLKDVVATCRHIRSDSHPLFHRSFRRLCRRTMPFVVFAVWPWQLHWPYLKNSLSVYRRV